MSHALALADLKGLAQALGGVVGAAA